MNYSREAMEKMAMAADGASGAAAVGLGIKSGLFAVAFAIALSIFAVLLGFSVFPLTKGRELEDARNRLAAGLLCSFTLGPLLAFKAIDAFPWVMTPWLSILKGQHILWQYLAAGAPFLAVTAVLGFWLAPAVMLWFTKRAGKDIGEIINDAKGLKP